MSRKNVFLDTSSYSMAGKGAAGRSTPRGNSVVYAPIEKDELPMRRIVLMKEGLLRIERFTEIEGNAVVDMYFQPGHFDDAQRTLVIRDESGEMVATSYATGQNQIKREDPPTLFERAFDAERCDFLVDAMDRARGTEAVVTTKSGSTVEGLLLGEQDVPERRTEGASESMRSYTLFNKGTLYTVALADIQSVSLKDEAYANDLTTTLRKIAYPPPKRADHQKITIQTKGATRRGLVATYALEQQGWTSTYRLAVGIKEDAVCPYGVNKEFQLQGWAEVVNGIGDSWKNIELTLIGRDRRRGGLETGVAKPTIGNITVFVKSTNGRISIPMKPFDLVVDLKRKICEQQNVPVSRLILLYGGKLLDDYASLDSCAIQDGCAVLMYLRAPVAEVEGAAGKKEEASTGGAAGNTLVSKDTFRHTIGIPITLHPNEQALVPIVNVGLRGRFVVQFDRAGGMATNTSMVASRVLQLTNSTEEVIEGGTLNISLDEMNVQVVNTRLFNLLPQEHQYIALGQEPGCLLNGEVDVVNLGIHTVNIDGGEIKFLNTVLRTNRMTIRNKLQLPVEALVDLPISSQWEILESGREHETISGKYRFTFNVDSEPVHFVVRDRKEESDGAFLKSLERDVLDRWNGAGKLDADTYALLLEIVTLKEKQTELLDSIQVREEEVADALETQERFRKNITTLTAGAVTDKTGFQQYSKELTDLEEKLIKLTDTTRALKSEEKIVSEKFQKMCSNVKRSVRSKAFDSTDGKLVTLPTPEITGSGPSTAATPATPSAAARA